MSTYKQVFFRSAAREKILRGATALADAVRVTLGPKSKSVLIGHKWGKPIICNDGVTIAKELSLKDPEEDLGVQVLREAAERTGDAVGDGTTTATLLAYGIFSDGLRNIAAGASAIDLKHGLDRGLRVAVTALRAQSRPVETQKERAQVAAIAAHNDAVMGELVAQAVAKVGPEGAITVEEAKGTETTLENVHDAWSTWRDATRPDHPSLVPFAELAPDVQELDRKYADAIREVAERHNAEGQVSS